MSVENERVFGIAASLTIITVGTAVSYLLSFPILLIVAGWIASSVFYTMVPAGLGRLFSDFYRAMRPNKGI